MQKTTVYFPPQLRRALKDLAARAGRSEAELIRDAVRALAESAAPPPKLPLFRASGPSIAERTDEALKGFGRR